MAVRTILVTAMGIMLLTPAAFAAPAGPLRHRPAGIDKREQRQVDRIRRGIRQDEITKAEADRLEVGQAAIRAEERVYRRSGGGLNRGEVKDLENDLNKTSRQIRRATHNDITPGGN